MGPEGKGGVGMQWDKSKMLGVSRGWRGGPRH